MQFIELTDVEFGRLRNGSNSIIRPVNCQELLTHDLLVGKSSIAYASCYFYSILPMNNNFQIESNKGCHGYTIEELPTNRPLYMYLFRSRPLKAPCQIEMAEKIDEMRCHVKVPLAVSYSMQRNLELYDPRIADDVMLQGDWACASSVYESSVGEDNKDMQSKMVRLGEIIGREFKKRGLSIPESKLSKVLNISYSEKEWFSYTGGVSHEAMSTDTTTKPTDNPIAYLLGGSDVLIDSTFITVPDTGVESLVREAVSISNPNFYYGIPTPEQMKYPIYSIQSLITHNCDDMMAYPARYFGSKRRMVRSILESIPKDTKLLIDGFAGSGVVSYFARKSGINTLGIDISPYSQSIYNSIIVNKEEKFPTELIDTEIDSTPVKGIYSEYDHPKWIPSEVKQYIDGFVGNVNGLSNPIHRDIAKLSLAKSIIQMSAGGIPSKGMDRFYMERNGMDYLGCIKKGIRKYITQYNNYILTDGGVSSFILGDLNTILPTLDVPKESLLYLDPPYILDTGNNDIYNMDSVYQPMLYNTQPEKRKAWGVREWISNMDKILEDASHKFKYVLLSYEDKNTISLGIIKELISNWFTNVKVKRIPYLYTSSVFVSKSPQPAVELLILMSNEPIPADYYKCEFLSMDDEYRPLPELGKKDVRQTYPPMDLDCKFVLQAHVRGRSVHLDLRRQLNEHWYTGITLDLPSEYQLKTEGGNFTEIKAEVMKLWKGGLDKFIDEHKFLAQLKPIGDVSFLNKEGYVEGQGYFIILDKGSVEYGSLKDDYHEYFYHGSVVNGKYVDVGAEDKWYFSKSNMDTPYIITPRAIKTGYWPGPGIAAIPKSWYSNVPESHRWWDLGIDTEQEAKKLRDEYVQKYTSNGKTIHINDSFYTIRNNNGLYEFNILSNGQCMSFESKENPITSNVTSVLQFKPVEDMIQGDLMDSGMADILELSEDRITVKLDGEFKDTFIIENKDMGWSLSHNVSMESFSLTNEYFQVESTRMMQNGYMELEGILFRPGIFKGKKYSTQVLKDAPLSPGMVNQSVAYINLFHKHDEISKAGIMTEITWDADAEWMCVLDKQIHKGAKRFKGILTNGDAIRIVKSGVYQVSAEVLSQYYENMEVIRAYFYGMAIVDTPAVDGAHIEKACLIQGNSKTCDSFPSTLAPGHL